MRSLRQSTAYNLLVFMTDSTDHISGKTGRTLTITASKDGAAFSSISPTVTERGDGWYNIALTPSHTDTIGDLGIHITATGADPTDLVAQVRAAEAIIATNLDATVSSRSAPGTAQTISSNADIAAIKAKTDNLPASPAAVGSQMDLVNAPNATAINAIQSGLSKPGTAQTITSNADIAAIKAKTDNLPASPSSTSDIPSAATNASAVRTELATELARVDAAVSSRLSSGAYTAPDNTGIGQINARLPSDPADQSLLEAAIAAIPAAPTAQQIAIEILDNQTA